MPALAELLIPFTHSHAQTDEIEIRRRQIAEHEAKWHQAQEKDRGGGDITEGKALGGKPMLSQDLTEHSWVLEQAEGQGAGGEGETACATSPFGARY